MIMRRNIYIQEFDVMNVRLPSVLDIPVPTGTSNMMHEFSSLVTKNPVT